MALKLGIDKLHSLLEELVSIEEEQPWLEFKMNKGSVTNEEIGEYISALSNGATISNRSFGYLVWGVKDKTHEIKGTNMKFVEAKQGNQDLELWLRNLLNPKVNFEIYEFKYSGKHISFLRIPAAIGEPTHFKKKPYIRINSHKTDLQNFPDYSRIIYNAHSDWSSEVIENATFDDLCPEAVAEAKRIFIDKSRNESWSTEIDEWDETTLLDKAKITINGKLTRTAIILLGKPESINHLLPAVGEITWKLDTEEKAYEHFGPPMLLNTTKVLKRIRNIRYKFFPDNKLLATEVDKYEPRVILEALHNALAHQDYLRNSRIIITEKTDKLIFSSAGGFYHGNPEDYVLGDKTPDRYRNPWLTKAMVNLNMIDTMGYGIHTMFLEQRKRFFPLPDYSNSYGDKVVLEIYGQVIDENYSKLLIENQELPLSTVILLDKIQKRFTVTDKDAKILRKQGLIEGRKPNYFVAAHIAEATKSKVKYIKNRGFDDEYYKNLIIEFIRKFGNASKKDIDDLILDKLPAILEEKQKRNKVRNLIYDLSKRKQVIENKGTSRYPIWVLKE